MSGRGEPKYEERWKSAGIWIRHLVLAPLLLASSLFLLNGAFRDIRDGVLNAPWPQDIGSRNVVLLNTPHWSSATYLIPCLGHAGRPYPQSAHLLNLSPYPARLVRTGPATLELRLRCGELLTTEFERLERKTPIPAGTAVDAGVFRATVLEAGIVGPKAVRFDFSEDLDRAPMLVQWDTSHYKPLVIPPVGAAVELPALSQGIGRLRSPAPSCGEP